MRCSVVGWLPNHHCHTGGGVRSATERSASCCCRPTNAAGSCVAASAPTSARASMRRLRPFCSGSGEQGGHRQQRQDPRHVLRPEPPVRAAHQQAEAADRGQRGQRAEQRAGQHVVLAGVGQLVGHHRQRLVLRQVAHQRVVQDDAPRAAEARDVGVQRRGAPRRVGDQHVVDDHALLLGQRQHAGAQRARGQRRELVEQRLDQQRVDERAEQHQHPERRAGHRGPAAAPAPGHGEQHHGADRGGHDLHGLGAHQVGGEPRPRLLGEPEGALPAAQQDGEGQGDDPAEDDQDQHRPHGAQPPRAAQAPHEPGAERREPQAGGDGQGDQRRGQAPDPGPARVVLAARELPGAEPASSGRAGAGPRRWGRAGRATARRPPARRRPAPPSTPRSTGARTSRAPLVDLVDPGHLAQPRLPGPGQRRHRQPGLLAQRPLQPACRRRPRRRPPPGRPRPPGPRAPRRPATPPRRPRRSRRRPRRSRPGRAARRARRPARTCATTWPAVVVERQVDVAQGDVVGEALEQPRAAARGAARRWRRGWPRG